MANPTLAGTTIPCPTDSTRDYILLKAEATTIGGKTRWDVFGRKYTYKLNYDFVSVSDYESMETLVNNLTEQTFIWDKYDSCDSTGVSVLAELSSRQPKTPGNKDTGFYSKVTLTLSEVSSRI